MSSNTDTTVENTAPEEAVTEALADDIRHHIDVTLGQVSHSESVHAAFKALCYTMRSRLFKQVVETRKNIVQSDAKRAHYLSLEFLMGRLLTNAVSNLDLEDEVAGALKELGYSLEEIIEEESDPGLGNGGLGRLAACFLDSCASLKLPVTGHGIRYRYGMFEQRIENGHQTEMPDMWLQRGLPWEMKRPERARRIRFHGHVEHIYDESGRVHVKLHNTEDVIAVPYDVPVPGYRNDHVNVLRLWSAKASEGFDLNAFNAGDYQFSVVAKNQAEEISMVLYPNDHTEAGKLLRLRQQYFLSSASLQDMIDAWVANHGEDFEAFAEGNCFQLNDTHPICAIPELMRLLMDEYGLAWDKAWSITRRSMAYTNHTLLPEALEQWPVKMFEYLLPRLMEIVREIDRRFRLELEMHFPANIDRIERLAIITRGDNPQVRMAHLGVVGSFSVNGVAALHTELLKSDLFSEFNELFPGRINNKTNGVTHRRWLLQCNPMLSGLISETIGDDWVLDTERLAALAPHAEDAAFRSRWYAARLANKQRLADLVNEKCGVSFDPSWLVDIQVKRIHEYKRQLLNVLHVIHLYDRIQRGDTEGMVPRFVLIGGKAAPGYWIAKLIIKLINNVAGTVNGNAEASKWLKAAFFPNYGVTAMEHICPAADLSEQISTAGKEASGTGNMKFMMNGSLTIGTMDGANIEIHEAVGEEHFFRFGLETPEVKELRKHYDPGSIVAADENLQRVIELLNSDHFSASEPGLFRPLIDAIMSPSDPWMTVADFGSYIETQQRVASYFADQDKWLRSSILNTAHSGRFSSDRTIREYADDIWKIKPLEQVTGE